MWESDAPRGLNGIKGGSGIEQANNSKAVNLAHCVKDMWCKTIIVYIYYNFPSPVKTDK